MSPREVYYDQGKKLIPLYCPICGIRYLKPESPDTQYVCMLCHHVLSTKKKILLRGEYH